MFIVIYSYLCVIVNLPFAPLIFCSQFAPAGWHNKISETTLADAILDRIVHDSYTIEFNSSENLYPI
ncbi:ATP-binding protein [Sporomusa acidovorans]|uniref:ATP-binding protein n=1 Tax=Sporomusa acidovorans TaxID=112900 RepID=UPI001FE094E1|nr:ATP-binding protein [Sporomusa acidovorans]